MSLNILCMVVIGFFVFKLCVFGLSEFELI